MKAIRILHIEDDERDACLVAAELEKAAIVFTQTLVSTRAEFMASLEESIPDIIFSDHSLPAFNSLEALKIVQEKGIQVPFILVSGNTSQEFAVSAIKAGAGDYILKDALQRLPAAVQSSLEQYDGNVKGLKIQQEKQAIELAAREEINKLAARLQLATSGSGIGIWDWDMATDQLTWDAGMYQLYNTTSGQFGSVYEAWLMCLHPEDKERIENEIHLAINGEKEYNTEFRVIWGDGSFHYIKAGGTVERDNEGNAIRMTGINWDISVHKKEEHHLKLLESVITNTTDSVMITEAEPFDKNGHRIVYVNEAFTIMTGYTLAEIAGKTPKILQGPKSDMEALKRLGESIKKWEPCEITIINYKKNGEEFWINFSISPVADEKGWFTHWISIEKDITQRKNEELQKMLIAEISRLFGGTETLNELLQDVLTRLVTFADIDMGEIWLIAKDRQRINRVAAYSSSNELQHFYSKGCGVKSFAKGECLPGIAWEKKTMQFCQELCGEKNIEGLDDAKKTGLQTMYGLPIIYNDEVIGTFVLGINKKEKIAAHLTGLFENLGLHMGAEIKRKQVEQELNQIIRFAPDLVCIVGLNGYFLKINPAGCDLLQYTEAELKAVPLIDFIHPDDKARTNDSIQQIRESQVNYYTENRYITQSGDTKWIAWTSSRIQEEELIFAVGKDITDRKLSEIHLKELNKTLQKQARELAESNADLEQFAYVASHDLQEPLRMVTSFLTLIDKKYSAVIDDTGKQYIHYAVDGANRMRQIILDLLEFSRVGRKEDSQAAIDLNEMVNDIRILFRKQIQDKSAVILADSLPVIYTYKTTIRQVFQNLIGNALKYTRKDIPAVIGITATETELEWQFAISDNGIGVSRQYFDKIFLIFQRLHTREAYAGTGMGLAITKKIIESRGGKIWLQSEEGCGSTFYFTLRKPG